MELDNSFVPSCSLKFLLRCFQSVEEPWFPRQNVVNWLMKTQRFVNKWRVQIQAVDVKNPYDMIWFVFIGKCIQWEKTRPGYNYNILIEFITFALVSHFSASL
jgi:hypothetical protein